MTVVRRLLGGEVVTCSHNRTSALPPASKGFQAEFCTEADFLQTPSFPCVSFACDDREWAIIFGGIFLQKLALLLHVR